MRRKTAILLFLAVLWQTSPSGGETVLLTNGEWPPYLSRYLPGNGAASMIVREAFEVVGIKTEYEFFPWKRSYRLAKNGSRHGTLVWVYTPERAESFYYSDGVIRDPEYLFHLRTFDLEWEKIEDLAGLTIGGTLHTVYPGLEDASRRGLIILRRAGDYETLYRRLLKGRIDAVPQVGMVGHFYLRTLLSREERARIRCSGTVLQDRVYHLILSKKHPAGRMLMDLFNRGLAVLMGNGRYGEIMDALETGAFDPD